jgi:hypothetical protein
MIVFPLLVIGTYALYLGSEYRPSALIVLYILAGLGAGAVTVTPVAIIRAFPAPLRFSGLSFAYKIANAVFGGITPLFVSWLAHLNPINPAHHVAFATAIGLLSTLLLPRADYDQDRSATEERPPRPAICRTSEKDASPALRLS